MIGDLPAYGSERDSANFVEAHPYHLIECRFDSAPQPTCSTATACVEPWEALPGSVETEFLPETHRSGDTAGATCSDCTPRAPHSCKEFQGNQQI